MAPPLAAAPSHILAGHILVGMLGSLSLVVCKGCDVMCKGGGVMLCKGGYNRWGRDHVYATRERGATYRYCHVRDDIIGG